MSVLPPGPFGAILADPPWSFVTYSGPGVPTQAADPYKTMNFEDLAHLPIGDLAAKDSALFMWVLGSHIPQALALGAAWGFEFKTDVGYWVKDREGIEPAISMGYWSRKQVEPLFLFTRGRPTRKAKDVRQIIYSRRGRHSAKPDQVYAMVESLMRSTIAASAGGGLSGALTRMPWRTSFMSNIRREADERGTSRDDRNAD
jgi:N6-adenosine-specific RNA methylase IME4